MGAGGGGEERVRGAGTSDSSRLTIGLKEALRASARFPAPLRCYYVPFRPWALRPEESV